MSIKNTDVNEVFSDLNGGVLQEQLGHILSDVAGAVTTHSGKGTIVLTLNIERIAVSNQVAVAHVLKYSAPTSRGIRSETSKGETPMYVNEGGKMTAMPEKQADWVHDQSRATQKQ